jgi:ribosomal protein S18 acetylase RimI-like enzyme
VYELSVVEEQDVPELCKFVVSTFGADVISLSSDMNNIERMLLNPAAALLNGYSGVVAFAEVYSGTKQRLSGRIQQERSSSLSSSSSSSTMINPNIIAAPDLKGLTHQEKITKVEKNSLILILVRKESSPNDAQQQQPPQQPQQQQPDIIASIELRLQPCDAKIPFSIPWLDRVERRLGSVIGLGMDEQEREAGGTSNNLETMQPYLSNLCVEERYRGKKIGRALVRCVENIANLLLSL